MPVTVITDSSAQLSPELVARHHVQVIPLHLLVDGRDLLEGADEVPGDLHQHAEISTAGATPADLTEAYRRALADNGGAGVVSVHLSAALSGTHDAAVAAAQEFGGAVRVIDSRSVGAGVGFVVRAAAEAATAGAGLDQVAAAARDAVTRGRVFLVVSRLDELRRSGRIGTAASWVGTALSLKPLLAINPEGRLVLAQRIRTVSKARAAMLTTVCDTIGTGHALAVVQHVDDPAAAAAVAAALAERVPQLGTPPVLALGPVLGVHVGSGAVGVCLSLRD